MVTLSENAQTVFCKRYPLRGNQFPLCQNCRENHETVEQLFLRVSRVGKGETTRAEYYHMLSTLTFLPNSPTLFNANAPGYKGTLSACFKFDVADRLLDDIDSDGKPQSWNSIYGVAWKAAAVQKWGGGVGYYLGNLRPEGDLINSTHGFACGPVETMRQLYHHGVASLITQGGRREGAQMAILPSSHPDIRKFIHAKDSGDPNDLSTFNISISIEDSFMQQVEKVKNGEQVENEEYLLLSEMAESAWKSGDPGCYFIDNSEKDNPTPWLGKLTGTNPCGEVPLLDNEPCNLGSMNLTKFVSEDGQFDMSRLYREVETAIRFLDDILDANQFPHPDIEEMARSTRKLGLGVMGWADTLALMKIDYDSNAAIRLASEIMNTIHVSAAAQSERMADSRGPFPGVFLHPDIEDPDQYNKRVSGKIPDEIDREVVQTIKDLGLWRRNATLTCIAPTGSIAILAGVSSGIEPHFSLENTRTMGESSGGVTMVESITDKFDGFTPKTSLDIHYQYHLNHQSAFQTFTDLAASKTINMSEEATVIDVFEAYLMAWKMGLKGVTIYRNNSRSVQVLNVSSDLTADAPIAVSSPIPADAPLKRKRLPQTVEAKRHKISLGDFQMYMHTSTHPDTGELAELFFSGRHGSTLDGLFDVIGILSSISLQYGVPLDEIIGKMKETRFEPSGIVFGNDVGITHATSPYRLRRSVFGEEIS